MPSGGESPRSEKEDELALTLAAHEAEGVKSWRLEYRRKVQALREWCFEVQEHRYFNRFFLALIYLNTVVMAMEHHGMSSQLEFALLVTNFVFTFFFTVEVAIKITGMGFWDFWMDNFNRFDLSLSLSASLGCQSSRFWPSAALRFQLSDRSRRFDQ